MLFPDGKQQTKSCKERFITGLHATSTKRSLRHMTKNSTIHFSTCALHLAVQSLEFRSVDAPVVEKRVTRQAASTHNLRLVACPLYERVAEYTTLSATECEPRVHNHKQGRTEAGAPGGVESCRAHFLTQNHENKNQKQTANTVCAVACTAKRTHMQNIYLVIVCILCSIWATIIVYACLLSTHRCGHPRRPAECLCSVCKHAQTYSKSQG